VADVFHLRHVALDAYRRAALRLNHLGRVVNGTSGVFGKLRTGRGINLGAGRHHHLRPLPGESEAYRPSNATATAGDNRHFVTQYHSSSFGLVLRR
jgi:hypothetical protein